MGIIDGVYPDGSAVAKGAVRTFSKTNTPLVLGDANEVRNTVLALQQIVILKSTGATYHLNTGSLGPDDGVTKIQSYDGFWFVRIGNGWDSWDNTRLAKTGAYSAANANKGRTIALGGSAFYTLTFGAASDFDANFAVLVVNEDSGRGKTIACNGLSSFILWPGQSCFVFNQNNAWKVNPSFQRWAQAGVQIYVNPAGNDANDGLASGSGNAVATIARAYQIIQNYIDHQGGPPTINLSAGTFIESLSIQGQLTGINFAIIQGAGSALTTWRPGADRYCLNVGDNAEVQLRAIKIDNVGGANDCIGIFVHQDGVIDVLDDIDFGTFPTAGGSFHIGSDHGGFINLPASYKISGGASFHMNLGPNTVVTQQSGGTVAFNGTFTISLLFRIYGGHVFFTGVANYATGSATVTTSYAVDFLGSIFLQGTSIPGGAGATSHGSQVG